MLLHEDPNINALMKRGYLFLEDHEWKSAKGYFDDSLDIDPENARAYIGMLLSELHLEKETDIIFVETPFAENYYYKKALRFAEGDYAEVIQNYVPENTYQRATRMLSRAGSEQELNTAKELFASLGLYKDSAELKLRCIDLAKQVRTEERYSEAVSKMNSSIISDVEAAANTFKSLGEYKDSQTFLERSMERAESLKKVDAANTKRKKIRILLGISLLIIVLVAVIITKSSANAKKADEVYANFLGKTFEGEFYDDDGFGAAYRNGTLNEYSIYWLDTDERKVTFNEDGSVYYYCCSDLSVLAYPKNISEPEGVHNEYDGTYSSFSVNVTFGGKVYVRLGGTSYEVRVDENNIPQKILNYHDITLE